MRVPSWVYFTALIVAVMMIGYAMAKHQYGWMIFFGIMGIPIANELGRRSE